MELIVFIIFTAAWLFASAMCFLYEAHMFQLNSYSAPLHIKWTVKNAGGVLPNIFSLVFAAAYIVFGIIMQTSDGARLIQNIIMCAAMLLFALMDLPKKGAKTPLVFTARVKRLLFTYTLIGVAAAVAAWLLRSRGFGYAVLFAHFALSPFILLLSNLINAPVEAAVKRWYLNDALKILRSCPDLKVIGITGSYGKTSMKFFLYTILRQKFNVLITPGNYNTPMGVVKTVRSSLRGYHEYFICEMGAKGVGEIKELCDIASPLHGIVTSIGPQHLESFKSIENIISTKLELANNLNGGKAFLNIDNEYIKDNLTSGAVTYGTSEDADYRAEVKSVSRAGTEFTVTYPNGKTAEFSTTLIGAHNVVNLCGAIAMAHFLGVEDSFIKDGVSRITPVPHRLQLIQKGELLIIDDAYNSNPSGCRAALDTLGYFDEYKILVTPGMVELGSEEERLNREFGTEAAAVCDYVILVGEKQTRPILQGLHDAGFGEDKIYTAADLSDAMSKVYSLKTDRKKAVLLENDLPDNY